MLQIDTRWPFLPFLFIRLVQLALGVFHLGIFGYMLERSKDLLQINITDPGSDIIVLMEMFESYLDSEGPESIMNLFTAAFIITWVIISFILFFTGLLLPLAVILIDALCFVFLFASIICVSEYGFTKCTTLQQYNNLELICILRKGHFSALVISMLLFIMTLIGASIVLHTTRKDIYGTKHNSSDYIDFQIEVANPRHVEQGRNHGQNPQQMQQELYAQPSTQRRPIQQLSPVINTPQSQYYPEQQQQYALGTSYDGFGSTPPRTSARNSPYIGGHSAVSLQLVSQQDFSELSAPPPRNGGEPAT